MLENSQPSLSPWHRPGWSNGDPALPCSGNPGSQPGPPLPTSEPRGHDRWLGPVCHPAGSQQRVASPGTHPKRALRSLTLASCQLGYLPWAGHLLRSHKGADEGRAPPCLGLYMKTLCHQVLPSQGADTQGLCPSQSQRLGEGADCPCPGTRLALGGGSRARDSGKSALVEGQPDRQSSP